jgi:O-antigen ligase
MRRSRNSSLRSEGSLAEPASMNGREQPAAGVTIGDHYLVVLAGLLCGYAIFGKAFAYLGVPPLYVGEMVFLLGILAFLHSRCAIATFATLPMMLLGLLASWVVLRTLPYISEYGVDALRDSVIVLYSGFAVIVTALLLERPERLSSVISFLRVLAGLVVILAPVLLVLRLETTVSIGGQPLSFYIKSGTLAVHLGGAALLLLLGFMRQRLAWTILLLIGISLAFMQTRGGMLAFIIPLIVAVIATGRLRQFAVTVAIVAAVTGLIYVLDPTIPTSGVRDISVTQMFDNFSSIFGFTTDSSNASAELEGTKRWRLEWWDSILDYTFAGPYFWTGKGFGINLALADGFLVGLSEYPGAPFLRSPHNAHLTILARAGVPGLVLWLITLVSWSVMLLANMVRARRRGDHAWADFFVVIFCYALGFIIEGTFDVALEGPMSGIWFWCLFGLGVGATMIYRASPNQAGVRHTSPADLHVRVA